MLIDISVLIVSLCRFLNYDEHEFFWRLKRYRELCRSTVLGFVLEYYVFTYLCSILSRWVILEFRNIGSCNIIHENGDMHPFLAKWYIVTNFSYEFWTYCRHAFDYGHNTFINLKIHYMLFFIINLKKCIYLIYCCGVIFYYQFKKCIYLMKCCGWW